MKHLLPILTLALLGTAVTASASNYYYDDYYLPENVTITTAIPNSATIAEGLPHAGTYTNESDTVTYKTIDSTRVPGTNVLNDANTFTVHRESVWGNTIDGGANPNNFFRIEIGGDNDQLIDLYLTDYVSNVVWADGPYKSTANALFNDMYGTVTNPDTGEPTGEQGLIQRAIVKYGYRELTKDAKGNYTTADDKPTKTFDTVVRDDSNGKITIDGLEGNYKLADNVTMIDNVAAVNRYQYYLGTFEPGQVIEVYMKDSTADGMVYSSSSYVDGEYKPFDPTTPFFDEDAINKPQGGLGDGGYVIATTDTDQMLYGYYFNEELAGDELKDYTRFANNKTEAAKKAMPLSQLIPTNGFTVTFGIYGRATGEAVPGGPLPGGLQIALIAGLFGLGFCYIRRRKAIVC